MTQVIFCKLTILMIWTGEPLHRQRKDPEQMYLQHEHERPQYAALHSPDAKKKKIWTAWIQIQHTLHKKHGIHRPFKTDLLTRTRGLLLL